MGFDKSMAFRDCPWCGLRDAQMALKASWSTKPPQKSERHWSTVACPRCGSPVILETNASNANPPRELGTIPDTARGAAVDALPTDVADYYVGARRVLDAGVPDAAAVQLRRTLEAAAAHFGVNDNWPLVKRVQALIDQGLITKQFGEVLDHIRKVGNVGAHASDENVDEATAERAYSFTTQVLRNLFEIPAQLAAIDPAASTSP
jgi:Domain of unknown function (DUF4145)